MDTFKVEGTHTISLTLPFNLTEEEVVPEPDASRPVGESLDFLANEADSDPWMSGEKETIIIATAALLQKGVPLEAALDTAIIWQRG